MTRIEFIKKEISLYKAEYEYLLRELEHLEMFIAGASSEIYVAPSFSRQSLGVFYKKGMEKEARKMFNVIFRHAALVKTTIDMYTNFLKNAKS